MNSCISDWNFEGDFPINSQKNPSATGADHDLVELLWRNGQVVLQSQTHRKQAPTVFMEPSSQILQNPIRLCEDETVSWLQYPIEDSFEREFCSNLFSVSPACDPMGADSQMPPPKVVNFGVDSSRCGSNQEAKMVPSGESARTETVKPTETSSSGGSGSSFGRATMTSGNINNKRKCREAELECQSEDAELESKPMDKSSQRSGTSRKNRAAEVHNLSERRRRDRINEKMKALQELIPHSNKTDKASMLDEAIEYLKSLQLQLQVMWMGSCATPMMFPGVQPHYMSRVGPPSMPPSAMHLPGQVPHGSVVVGPGPHPYSAAFANTLSYHTHPMQNASFAEQYARLVPMNVFRHQQGQYLMAQQLLRNGPSSGGAQINGGLNAKNMG